MPNASATSPPVWLILSFVALFTTVAIVVALTLRNRQRPPDNAWKGVFYSNPDDRSLFVPKRCGIGYTVNFGHPLGWVVFVFILVMAVLPLLLTWSMVHKLPR